jgi:dipeptidase
MKRQLWISLSFTYLTLLIPITSASAETYKCVDNGVSTYTQTPCPDTATQSVHKSSNNVSDKDYQQAIKTSKKEKADLNSLLSARSKEEEKYQKEQRKISTKNEKDRQKCAALQLSAKWAKEDLANATAKSMSKAKSKLKKANEKAELQCKSGAGQ